MKAHIIVDMQFGSTGKGAVAAYLAREGVGGRKFDASVRVQSVQAGHTIYHQGRPYKMRTIPCAWVDPDVELVLGPGCFFNKRLLVEEIDMIRDATGHDPRERLSVDYRAFNVIQADVDEEWRRALEAGVGSTAHGAGASLIRKLWRQQPIPSDEGQAGWDPWFGHNGIRVCDTIELLNQKTSNGDSDNIEKIVLVEGCQGALLSIHTSPYYPYVTTREATASGIAAEAGIAPSDVEAVHGVFRSLPIRVGGNSGPAAGRELTWAEVNERAGREVEPERTTVTNRVRRIFEFSHEDFAHSLRVNKPQRLYMTFADYLGPDIYGARQWDRIGPDGLHALTDFLAEIEYRHGVKVDWIGTGEQAEHFLLAR